MMKRKQEKMCCKISLISSINYQIFMCFINRQNFIFEFYNGPNIVKNVAYFLKIYQRFMIILHSKTDFR